MQNEIPYYILDEEGNVESFSSNAEAYIDDNDLKDLLIDFLGDDVSPEEIQKILDAASDEELSEEDFDKLVEEARKGIRDAGGYGARYFCTDMCDGESQGTDGINYSLVSREMIANMIEIQANATPFDGGVFIASCDKGMPGNLIGMARVNLPSVVIPGGTMAAGPKLLTLNELGVYSARYERKEIRQFGQASV